MDGFDFDDFAGGVSGENPFAEGETADASGKRLLSSPRGDVYYWVTRCPRDEAGWMVLLHGAAMDHTVFDGIAGWLSEKYNLIVPDLPLHGLSEEYGEFSFDACAYDVRDILNNEHADRAAVLGHCIGGCAAQAFAAAFPEYCAGLILADTFPFGNELYGYADLSFFERAAGILRVMRLRCPGPLRLRCPRPLPARPGQAVSLPTLCARRTRPARSMRCYTVLRSCTAPERRTSRPR
jgi:pimeloyl-ACP methyl ester carboxylesterase